MSTIGINGYENQMKDIAKRASEMKRNFVEPFRMDDGSFMRINNKADAAKRDAILAENVKGTAYECSPNGSMIAGVHARALQGYEKKHGHLPSDELLASVHKSVENVMKIGVAGQSNGLFEAADMSTSDGIIMRDRLVSLVLPVQLQSITANMVTHIPADFNQSEFFRIYRVAGSTFGDLAKGDKIDYDFQGQYAMMDQRKEVGDTDGLATTYSWSSAMGNNVVPILKKRCKIFLDKQIVAADNGEGVIAGKFKNAAGTTIVVSGTVDYNAGTIAATFSAAADAGLPLAYGYDVDIEKAPTLIPKVDHQMFSRVLYPHQAAINGEATIQAQHFLRREIGQDLENMYMQALRNLLAADKDRKHLHDMLYHAQSCVYWLRVGSEAITLREHYETLNAALLEVDTKLMKGTGVSGLVGIVGGTQAVNVFRYLPAPLFVPAPGYRSVAQPHYVGRVFGQWDLYCDPYQDSWTCLCFAKGPDHGQTAYVVGDAVPAITFRHPILGDLINSATMWELAYRDMQPFDGQNYLCKLIFTDDDTLID